MSDEQSQPITEEVAKKVLETVDAGLSHGMGQPIPGQMCIEAAVAYAMGEPHTDQPSCVEPAIRDVKIAMNDNPIWLLAKDPSKARAIALRRIAIAQLGSAGVVDSKAFKQAVSNYLVKIKTSPEFKQAWVDRMIKQAEEFITNLKADKHAEIEAHYDPVRWAAWAAREVDSSNVLNALKTESVEDAAKYIEGVVQILIKMGSPGTKFLYLTEEPPKAA